MEIQELAHNRQVQSFLEYATQSGQKIADNVETQYGVLSSNEHVFPLTQNDQEYANCYVVSPYSAYIDYACEELRSLRSKVFILPMQGLIRGVAPILRLARVNKAIHINNWLLSTNLFPKWDGSDLTLITSKLIERFPDRFLYFRSLNHFSNKNLMACFVENGYRLIPARQVYIFDMPPSGWDRKVNTQRDMRLLETTNLLHVKNNEFKASDWDRVRELYDALYLQKYTRLNPQFTAEFLKWGQKEKLFTFEGYRDHQGVLQAIVGTFGYQGTLTAPFVGYNTKLPKSMGLYRLLMAQVFRQACEIGIPLNLSAGAASFKRLRGGKPFIEYTAVYDRHLSVYRRSTMTILDTLLNLVGVPIMRKFNL